MPKKKKKRSKFSSVDPAYMDKQRDALKRKYRKTILFNEKELAAIKEYCSRFQGLLFVGPHPSVRDETRP